MNQASLQLEASVLEPLVSFGRISPRQVIEWADDRIRACAAAPHWLIEVALATDADGEAMVRLVRKAGSPPAHLNGLEGELLIGVYRRLLDRDPAGWRGLASELGAVFNAFGSDDRGEVFRDIASTIEDQDEGRTEVQEADVEVQFSRAVQSLGVAPLPDWLLRLITV